MNIYNGFRRQLRIEGTNDVEQNNEQKNKSGGL